MSHHRDIDGAALDQILTAAVAGGAVPNAVAVAADADGIFYAGAAGRQIADQDSPPVDADTHLRIMSMTKMVATTVALQQWERGALDIDAPIERYCPAWAEKQVLEGWDGDRPRLRPAASKATVRQLMNHTTGLSYWFWNADILKWQQVTGEPGVIAAQRTMLDAPLIADPGSRFEYGINVDWLGQVVEAVSGTALDVAIKEGVTGPLGMDETDFRLTAAQRASSTPIHVPTPEGWVSTGVDLNPEPDFWPGGHGLYSTPKDYLKFQRALLRGGELDGARILMQRTVDVAFTNQIGELDFPPALPSADPASSAAFDLGPGYKFGFGLLLNTEDVPGRRRAGTGAWAGLANTHYWIDRRAGVTGAIYSQFLPFVAAPALQMYADYETALYAALGG